MKARVVLLTMITAAALCVSNPARLYAQQSATPQDHEQHHPEATAPPAQTAPAPPKAMAGGAHDMMGMMAQMAAADARLDGLVKKMNAATGQAKVNATAELLTALVADRRAMNDAMMAHMQSMMGMGKNGMMGGGMMQGGMKDQMPEK